MKGNHHGRSGETESMDTVFNSVYKDKKVLVTGHTGFKGSWLTTWLIDLGAEIIGFSLEPPTHPNLFEVMGLGDKIVHVEGDVREKDYLLEIFNKYNPEFIFHMAAQPLVRFSYNEPKLTYETNIMGTVNVLEAVRLTKSIKVCAVITSDKCYENKEHDIGYRETDPMGGFDPYSSSKGCAELVVSAYLKSFFSSGDDHAIISSVRAGNVIGGGDWGEDRLIPDCIKALSQNQDILIRSPQAVRPWQFVLEPLSGYLWLGALMYSKGKEFSGPWNFGSDDNMPLTVEEVVRKTIELWGEGNYKVQRDTRYHETKQLMLDITKAKFYLKWEPVYKIDKALEKTLDWYKKYYKGKNDIYSYTLHQIRNYVMDAKKLGMQWSGVSR
jgi:CDP-glucose 4,6-dehydratase